MKNDIEIPEIKDKSDGKNVKYHKFVHNPFSTCYQNTNGDFLILQFYGLRKAKKDNRPLLLKIIHILEDKSKHEIELLVHLENHNKKQFHLNISGLSKNINCAFCNRYFTENYPNGLNHFPMAFKEYNEQDTTKFIDDKILLNEIEDYLNKKGIFKIFSEIKYSSDNRNRKILNIS